MEHIAAFSYQLAHECINDNILAELARRRELLAEIRELSGKGQ
jgi:hypothetical protein